MNILFVRHGESQANLLHEISNRGLKYGLTRAGRQQARRLASKLKGRSITRIYSSPLLRAVETSVILAEKLDSDYEVTDALREYDCGILEGRSDEIAWQKWQELLDAWMLHHHWGQRIPGGESYLDIRDRFEPFISSVTEQYGNGDKDVVCVSHGGLYWMMLPGIIKNLKPDFFTHSKFTYTACLVAELRPDGYYCVEWNGLSFAE